MRWLIVILGLYTTILTLMPCKDKDDFVAMIHHTTVSKTEQTDQGSCRETCSPFCICNCCSTIRNLPCTIIKLAIVEQLVNQNYFDLLVEPLRDQTIPIWQPPQLA